MDVFNNRELALYTWIIILTICVVIYKPTRKSIPGLLKSAFDHKLSVVYAIILAYTIGMVFLLHKVKLWDSSQIKNTILWFLTVGIVSIFDISMNIDENYLKKTVKDIFNFTAVVQFIIGIYTFSFTAEFILIPVIALMSAMIVFAQKPEYAFLKNILGSALLLFGFFIIGNSIYSIALGFKSFASNGTLSDFFVPGALSFLFLPFMYIVSLYISRENTFVGLKNIIKSPMLMKQAKWQTFIHFRFNQNDLVRWQRMVNVQTIETPKDVRESIRFVKQLKQVEKNPPVVSSAEGWSPFKAKDFLIQEGITTGYYQPIFENEWQTCSNYINIDDGFIANNIAYYITGDKHIAKRLKLAVNIHSPEKAIEAHSKLLGSSQLLYRSALEKDMPKILDEAIETGRNEEIKEGNKCISFYKNIWLDHKMNGYSLIFSISVIAE